MEGGQLCSLISHCLLNTHFPKNSPCHQLFNTNNVKLSCSCTPFMSSIISSHNRELLQKKPASAIPPTLCNCRKNTTCPLNGECCSKFLVYKAEPTCDYVTKYSLRNHILNFRHQEKRHSTELSKAYWNAIETGKHPNARWNIEKRARHYQNGSNRCNLCLEEKFAILQANPANNLCQNTELVIKHRHKA